MSVGICASLQCGRLGPLVVVGPPEGRHVQLCIPCSVAVVAHVSEYAILRLAENFPSVAAVLVEAGLIRGIEAELAKGEVSP